MAKVHFAGSALILFLVSLIINGCDGQESKSHYTYIIPKGATILTGMPNRSLEDSIVKKLIDNCEKDNRISEVYQYGMTNNDEFSLVLGFRLTDYSDNAKQAAIHAVENAIDKQTIEQLLDMHFIKDDDDYKRIKAIKKALVYKK